MSKLAITLKRSMIGCRESQRATLKALGLQKRESCVVQPDNASIRGMINRVSHLVEIKEVQ